MIASLKKTGRYIARALLSLAALLLIGVIALQLALVAGINIVSTGRGTDFFEDKINAALTGSGYRITFSALYYDPVRGFTIHDLTAADAQGPFMTIDRISVAADYPAAAMRTLALSVRGGTLAWLRSPVTTQDDAENDALSAFTLPDIYFRTIAIDRFSLDSVMIGTDTPYQFSPQLRARATIADPLTIHAVLEPGMPAPAPGMAAPDTIDIAAQFSPSTLAATLESLTIAGPSYDIAANGHATLGADRSVSLSAQARHTDIRPLTQEALATADIRLMLQGPLNGPALDLKATILPAQLKERGVGDISLSLSTTDITHGMTGDVQISSVFRDRPVTLGATLAYEEPYLHITALKGEAPALALTGAGTWNTDAGIFKGDVALSAENLATYADLLGVALAGKIEAQAHLDPRDGKQGANIEAKISNAAYDGITAQSITMKAAFDDIGAPCPHDAKLNAIALRLPDNALTLDNLYAAVTAADAGRYKLTTNGRGSIPRAFSFDGSAMISELTESMPAIRDIALTASHAGAVAKINGSLTRDGIDLTLQAKDIYGRTITDISPELADARISVDATMTGSLAQPQTTLTATAENIGAGAYQGAAVTVTAQHDGKNITATLTGKGSGLRKLSGNLAFPMTMALQPFAFTLDKAAPLAGGLAADIDLAAITPLFLPPTLLLSGTLMADGTVAGTLSRPEPAATLRITDSTFTDENGGVDIKELSATAHITRERLRLENLSGTDGKSGRLEGRGTLTFSGDAADLTLRMRDFNAPRTDLAEGTLNADLALNGTNQGLNLSGTVDIAELHILIPETFNSPIPQLNIVEEDQPDTSSPLRRLTLDVGIEAQNKVFVRGWGLDAELGGKIMVTGDAATPLFNGTLSSHRGRYEEFGKRFTLSRADLRFQGEIPPSPYLDMEATIPAGDVTAAIRFSGPAQKPAIVFASTPALPQDEVLSRILFDKDSSKISPFQAIQLARTIQRFSGKGSGGGLDPLGMLREKTGLDDISVESDESGGTNVGVGKYLADDVYLEVSKGKGEGSGAATIEIEVTPSINVESRIGQDAQGGGGVFWKRDY